MEDLDWELKVISPWRWSGGSNSADHEDVDRQRFDPHKANKTPSDFVCFPAPSKAVA